MSEACLCLPLYGVRLQNLYLPSRLPMKCHFLYALRLFFLYVFSLFQETGSAFYPGKKGRTNNGVSNFLSKCV
jgi:hypothetical protein